MYYFSYFLLIMVVMKIEGASDFSYGKGPSIWDRLADTVCHNFTQQNHVLPKTKMHCKTLDRNTFTGKHELVSNFQQQPTNKTNVIHLSLRCKFPHHESSKGGLKSSVHSLGTRIVFQKATTTRQSAEDV